VDEDGALEIKDFSIVWKPKRFKVDDDVFEAHPVLPLPTLAEMVKLGQGINLSADADPNEIVERFAGVFDLVLRTESAARFRARLAGQGDAPALDLQHQLVPILFWLLEAYGLRPTQPSENSSTGPNSTGEPSTDGAPPTASTLSHALTGADSPPGESST
jgi:hypothetical protein